MPSPIAHAVTGYCLGNIWSECIFRVPLTLRKRRMLSGIAIFSAVAADLDFLPQLVSDISLHRGISHSLGVGLLSSVILAIFLARGHRKLFFSVTALGFTAYLFHLLMDLVTTGGRGIPILWPLSSKVIQLPFTFFPQVHHSEGLFYAGHIPVLIFETVYAALLLGIVSNFISQVRKTMNSGRLRGGNFRSHTSSFAEPDVREIPSSQSSSEQSFH